jgi:hypothetical protein
MGKVSLLSFSAKQGLNKEQFALVFQEEEGKQW